LPPADDEFDVPSGKKPQAASSQKSGPAASQSTGVSDVQKKFANYEDVQAATQTNRYIIYKFMKKGFSSLTAEDLACTMVNPDFTIDFKKNTGEDWANSYQFKVIERLDHCNYNLQWVTKK
jgi:hypothetical protein